MGKIGREEKEDPHPGPLPSEWEKKEEKSKKDPLRLLRRHLPRQDGGGDRKD